MGLIHWPLARLLPSSPPRPAGVALVSGAGHAAPGVGHSLVMRRVACCSGPPSSRGVWSPREDRVGELSVGQGSGQLEGPDQQGEDAGVLARAEGGSWEARRPAMLAMPAYQAVVWPALSLCSAHISSRAANAAASSWLSRYSNRSTPALLAQPRASSRSALISRAGAELSATRWRPGPLRFEVGVEGAVGQPRVGHEGGDPGAVDAVALEPAASRLDDPPPGCLLVLFAVPHHRTLLHSPQGPPCALPTLRA